jgi:predicted O-methyltransferase YrrM
VCEYSTNVRPIREALAYVTGRSEEEVHAADDSELIQAIEIGQGPVLPDGSRYSWVVGLGSYEKDAERRTKGPIETFYGPSLQMMRLVSVACRLIRPDYVVETGVGKGFTTTSALDALERNGIGRVYSIELPSLYFGYANQVGERIPRNLRKRWELIFGPSAIEIPKVIREIRKVDVFIHDSAANYDTQKTEFGIALDHMPPGGILISNMLNSNAFLETAETTHCRWTVIEQSKDFPIGLLCKLSRRAKSYE